MRIVSKSARIKYNKLLEEYISKYGSLYSESALDFIKQHFLDEEFNYGFDVDIVMQVYQETGVYNDFPDNKYTKFYNYLRERYDLNQHLLEVASGKFPSFAKVVASRQRVGSVTVMDSDTIIDELEGLKIIKENITRETDVSSYDLIYAISPCEALEEIIRVANKNNIEFCALACGCIHIPFSRPQWREIFYGEYIDYLESILESTIPENLNYHIDYIEGIATPVIRTKKLR